MPVHHVDVDPVGAAPWRTLFRLAGARRVALILALMLVTSLTEGIGLILLVPVLQSLDPGAAPGGMLGRLLPGTEQPLALLLSLVVLLVIVRAGAAGCGTSSNRSA